MSDSSSLVGFLSDPSTLLALSAVAVGTAWYLSSSSAPYQSPIPLDSQTLEVAVRNYYPIIMGTIHHIHLPYRIVMELGSPTFLRTGLPLWYMKMLQHFTRPSREEREYPVREGPRPLSHPSISSWMYVFLADNGRCLGRRTDPKGPYVWVTYGEVEERAVAFGAGLCAAGVETGQNNFVGIYSSNCIEVGEYIMPTIMSPIMWFIEG